MLPTIAPSNLPFSQASLQDFVDCRRRYQLRHLLRLTWPAIESEPVLENERMMQQGALFHRLVQQYLVGIEPARLADMIHDSDLQRWWDNFNDALGSGVLAAVDAPENRRYVEVSLSAPLAGRRLNAQCDLALVGPDGVVRIFDWKTSPKRPQRSWLAARLQSRVYPYLLSRAGAHLNLGRAFDPGQIEMIYWFADYPAQPESFPYSQAQFQADEEYLGGLIDTIYSLPPDGFPLTAQAERCRFCVYRSLCARGIEAGSLEEFDLGLDFLVDRDSPAGINLDYEQIGEIPF